MDRQKTKEGIERKEKELPADDNKGEADVDDDDDFYDSETIWLMLCKVGLYDV